MLLPKSSCVCIPCIKSVAPRVCMAKVPFLAFFGPNMNTEMGVVIYMYLKHSPDYIDSEYIYVHCLTLQVQVFLLIYHFGILSLTQEKEEVWPGGT